VSGEPHIRKVRPCWPWPRGCLAGPSSTSSRGPFST